MHFVGESFHRLAAIPLVLSGPLCPAGISPPRGESPFSREAYILLANAVKIKVTRLHQKTPEYHITDTGKGNERIPPDGFDMAALENCCPQASSRGDVGVPLPISREAPVYLQSSQK